MKVNLSQWAALLVVVLLPFSVSGQVNPVQGSQLRIVPSAPPPHVLECMRDMELYRQYFIFRGSGLTIEEGRVSNGFSMRMAEFISRESKKPLEPGLAEKLDFMLAEVYNLAEDDFHNPTFQRGWGSLKMRTCVEENAPEPEAPAGYNRMIPERGA